MRNTSVEGMNFEYNYSGKANMAYFGYGFRSLVFEYPPSDWSHLSEKEKGDWRKAKYAEAMSIFGIKLRRGGHHGRV